MLLSIGVDAGQNDTFGRQAARTPSRNPFVDPAAWPAFLDLLEERAHREWGAA